MTEDAARYAYLAEGNAKQARKRVAVDLLIRDERGRVLVVNPTYKDYWDLPGGMAEHNEPPRQAGERELAEELGLAVTAGRLLLVDWAAPHGPWRDQLIFIFDAGTLALAEKRAMSIRDSEIGGFAFVPVVEAQAMLSPDMAERLGRAYLALVNGTTDYSER
ncbi:NUDIX domain-containing protein [Actinokineospora enzanensis]|uniref:NUDIX domain-containing protein n=1 Tax=Actinokineospora enzanensis TaxID=155975 RepID=UPI001FDF3F28|nr:NUDIX hydrolase [Actinokineospora enzanensis]